ncbi:MAG: ISAs1 family transposase [Arcicella sp.]|jgi:predicted transposase YbfD/YdcC|nr:ISAs1 family transposase [Arcicella sp.]
MLPCQEQNKSFFDQLQNAEGLDLRDTRGLRHELRVVLLGVTLAILSNRDGNLSSIHRFMVNHNKRILESINYPISPSISRSQLPNVLGIVCLKVFEGILFANFGVVLSPAERQWFALDGKELKGSIESGNTRGEVIVQAVTHQNRVVQSQDFYSGMKESEILTVRNILKDNNLERQKISMDALHCNPCSLESINESGGIYLVGLKDNQKELLTECIDVIRFSKPIFTFTQQETVKPKHGRTEIREYSVYDISEDVKAERWVNCKINTLIKVKRDIVEVKTQKKSTEISHHISNQSDGYLELCHAVRGHWSVEVVNHIRDVTFSEDDLTSKKKTYLVQWLV